MLMGGVGCLVCNRDVRTKDGLWFQWCYGRGGLFIFFLLFFHRDARKEDEEWK